MQKKPYSPKHLNIAYLTYARYLIYLNPVYQSLTIIFTNPRQLFIRLVNLQMHKNYLYQQRLNSNGVKK